jgi:protein-tyrosine phosphatase
MAELLFAACAAPGAVEVASAGLGALVGEPIDRSSAAVLAELGLDPSRHRARQFDPALAEQADLVLTAERAHRDAVIAAVPAAYRHTFTLKEFARLAVPADDPVADSAAGPAAGPRAVIAAAARRRADVGPVPLADDDVPDGYGLPVAPVRAIAREIAGAVKTAADLLAPPPARRPRPAARPLPRR